jgi:hypothetical protein
MRTLATLQPPDVARSRSVASMSCWKNHLMIDRTDNHVLMLPMHSPRRDGSHVSANRGWTADRDAASMDCLRP